MQEYYFKRILIISFIFNELIIVLFGQHFSFEVKPLIPYPEKASEYRTITDYDLLKKQMALMSATGGVDVLGQIRQYKNGKVDTSDFGQNVHFGYKLRFPPGEKQRAIKENQCMLIANGLRFLLQEVIKKKGFIMDKRVLCKISKYGSSIIITGKKPFSHKQFAFKFII